MSETDLDYLTVKGPPGCADASAVFTDTPGLPVCELTDDAMNALSRVAAALTIVEIDCLSALEVRTLVWCRASLAALCGIRVDEASTRRNIEVTKN